MHSLLIVDDERTAVRGLSQGIPWAELGVTEVYEAYNAKQAKDIMSSRGIHLLICDIEMPGGNGIELLEWVNEHSEDTVSIFLTGHADFQYARKALQLGSQDYLLKPARHEAVKEAAEQALVRWRRNRESRADSELRRQYVRQWEAQLPYLVERFWQDLVNQRAVPRPKELEASLKQFGIPLRAGDGVLPVLISVEMWREELTARDEEIMEYAMRKVAAEVILEALPGTVLLDRSGINLVLVYAPEGAVPDLGEVKRLCGEYVRYCVRHFKCSLSCYIGEVVRISGLPGMFRELLEMERANVSTPGTVQLKEELPAQKAPCEFAASPNPVADWVLLFEHGRRAELIGGIEERCAALEKKEHVSKEEIECLYASVLYTLYTAFHKKGLSVYEASGLRDLIDPAAGSRNAAHIRQWACRSVAAGLDYYQEAAGGDTDLIRKIKKYIAEHLHEEFSREDIAGTVYLNPSYLSRLFKKQTGVSLSDYIIQERMAEAKRRLAATGLSIGQVAEAVGYMNVSHFITMFKKVTGTTPMSYRKR
ncbi:MULTISPECIES: response regulator transcription factor [Paenibacillus]|uniref:response regulator transcription factor n=1 Tax=Paenibacillus TaxID=44249 RepID=UPI0022B8C0B2|nr:helix-turn-helix domain-containing protein [Paenibacillus caseinilyticus]MCZ8518449.1 response regulator [Paenibacillus caseinilyticus]